MNSWNWSFIYASELNLRCIYSMASVTWGNPPTVMQTTMTVVDLPGRDAFYGFSGGKWQCLHQGLWPIGSPVLKLHSSTVQSHLTWPAGCCFLLPEYLWARESETVGCSMVGLPVHEQPSEKHKHSALSSHETRLRAEEVGMFTRESKLLAIRSPLAATQTHLHTCKNAYYAAGHWLKSHCRLCVEPSCKQKAEWEEIPEQSQKKLISKPGRSTMVSPEAAGGKEVDIRAILKF